MFRENKGSYKPILETQYSLNCPGTGYYLLNLVPQVGFGYGFDGYLDSLALSENGLYLKIPWVLNMFPNLKYGKIAVNWASIPDFQTHQLIPFPTDLNREETVCLWALRQSQHTTG